MTLLHLPPHLPSPRAQKCKGAVAFAVYRPSDFVTSPSSATTSNAALSSRSSATASSSSSFHAASAASGSSTPLLIAIALRKRLIVYQWVPVDSRFRELRDMPLQGEPRSLLFAGADTLFIGYTDKYCTLALGGTGAAALSVGAAVEVDLFSPGKKGRPLMSVLPDGEILLGSEQLGIAVGWDGRPTRSKPSIDWQEVPTCIGPCFPFLVGVLAKGIVARSLLTTRLDQTLAIRGVQAIVARTDRPEVLILASATALYRLDLEPLPVQARV